MARSPDRILDELLVLKSQRGDIESLEQLVSRWHVRLQRHVWFLTQDREATADIVQETWLEIVRGIRRLKTPAAFRGWAFRIAGNKAADWMRRQKRDRALNQEIVNQANDNAITFPDEGDDRGLALLRRGIRMLPASSQQILSMKYLDRMPTLEIAIALNIPVGTVKSRLYHAREKLKQILQKEKTND